MNTLELALWVGAVTLIGAAVALAIVASRIRQPLVGAFAALPVVLGYLAHAFTLTAAPPHPAVAALLGIGLFLLAIVGGSPLVLFVLEGAERHPVVTGAHGGIVPEYDAAGPAREVLRGGATIGYLERLAVVGSIVTGNVGGVAVLVAVKGLGRFSELDSPEARERFIIGTLVSLIWASACAGLLLLLLA